MNIFGRSNRIVANKASRYARLYASATTSDKLRLTFVSPHKCLYRAADVQQVNLTASSGAMGILANHNSMVEHLNPGVIEIIENDNITKKFFVSGGYATVNPDSSLKINAVEAAAFEDISIEKIQSSLTKAQSILNDATSEEERASAKLEIEVYEALQAALSE